MQNALAAGKTILVGDNLLHWFCSVEMYLTFETTLDSVRCGFKGGEGMVTWSTYDPPFQEASFHIRLMIKHFVTIFSFQRILNWLDFRSA